MKRASIFLTTLILHSLVASAQIIRNGVPWFDERDSIVSAHGANIILDNGRYYMFGEYKTDSANVFTGFSCYSSADLEHWQWEGIALSQQREGRLGPNRVGERPKVLRCPSTGEYIMLMHSDNLSYKDPCVAYATSKKVTGPYRFQGPLLFNGKPIRKWDIGCFTDYDGTGYLLIHHGDIYRLSNNYHYAVERVTSGVKGVGESPAMFRKNGIYYWISSNTTSWERNDNKYFTAKDIRGPWTFQGIFAPEGSLTWNSQSSFVLPIVHGSDTIPMYMGDRWSFPKQRSAATYVWLPLQAEDNKLSIPQYYEQWDASASRYNNIVLPNDSLTPLTHSPALGEKFKFKAQRGDRLAIYGKTNECSAYAVVTIKKGRKTILQQPIDFYSLQASEGLRFLSPSLKKGRYSVTINVSDMKPNWADKRRNDYGSKGYEVNLTKICILSNPR
jgi:hypothetical protein